MVAAKNENNLFANRFFGPGMNVRRILYNFQHANTLAARGLEEPQNSQELLIKSVGPVFLFAFYVKFNTTSYVRTYGGTMCIYRLTDRRMDRQMDERINLGGAG